MRVSKIVTAVGAVLCGLALWGCGPSSSPPPATEAATPPKPQRFDIDFGKETDWAGGSSDYATSTAPSAVVFENRALPEGFTGSGLYSAGTNHSDDLFLFAKKKLQGLNPQHQRLLTSLVAKLRHSRLLVGLLELVPGLQTEQRLGQAQVEALIGAVVLTRQRDWRACGRIHVTDLDLRIVIDAIVAG